MTAKESKFPTFTWKIPSITAESKLLLCHGYIRQNTKKYIPSAIIKLFAMFYAKNRHTLDDTKSVKEGQLFLGPEISINGLKFYSTN